VSLSFLKRTAIVLLVLLLLITATVAGAYGTYWRVFRAPVVLRTNSPANTYSVVLNGRSDRPWLLEDHSVRFTISKGNEVVISQRLLHTGDALDPAYYILYPQHAWVSENVLHLYNELYFNRLGGSIGTVVVTNNSALTIKYMLVKAADAHLLLDLTPGSTATLQIPPPGGDWEWFYVEWMNEGGQVVSSGGQSFRQDRKQPSRCFIDISEQGASIDCPDLKK
jgi:hypothetical protein